MPLVPTTIWVTLTVVSTTDDELTRAAQWAEKLAQAERAATVCRDCRDAAIRRAVALGATERAAASAAGVGPSYAHRVARAGRSRSS